MNKIPDALIPELVKWLIETELSEQNVQYSHTCYHIGAQWSTEKLADQLTAALETFNEREVADA